MPDAVYKNVNFLMRSRGISARSVDDTLEAGFLLNQANVEELAENSLATRLGSVLVNQSGSVVSPLPGLIHSIFKLNGLSGNAWRYAAESGNLYRRSAAGTGPYVLIASGLSGSPLQAQAAQASPNWSSTPYLFIADGVKMLKDNGTLSAPQQMGIFQPQYPVQALAQAPSAIILDSFQSSTYSTSGTSSFTDNSQLFSMLLKSTVSVPGVQGVIILSVYPLNLFQSLVVDTGGQQETVLVLAIKNQTPSGTNVVCDFRKTHAINADIYMYGWSAGVDPSSIATISNSLLGSPIAGWPTTLSQEDYIGLALCVSDPTQIQSITLRFDCGDGSFNSDYFYKVIAQGPLQALLNTATTNSTDATTAATDALLDESLGLYGNSSGSIAQLNTGFNNWTPLLLQLSDFASAGRADFDDPQYNWLRVNGYQITVVMNDSSAVTVSLASLLLFGGAGPDTFAGVAYDYLVTDYNNVDGTESNPCMVMSNVNPPNYTNWVYPRRQPVLLTLTYPTVDPQTTSKRIYRRGGTLGDNYRRLDEVLITGSPQTYLDTFADMDIEQNDFVSFVNDVPVTSSLPVPVNTALTAAIATTNQVAHVTPASMANISIGQQVSLGVIGSLQNNFETVIVLSITGTYFTAFVQNTHAIGEPVSATAQYGKPCTIMAQAFNQFWLAGDTNNPNYLYFSASNNPQAWSSAAYVQVSTPDDTITVVVGYKGNLYVSTVKGGWFAVAPGSNQNASPTVYPTACKHGCVAPLGWVATEEMIFFQSQDGIRGFAGGASSYLSQEIEFLFQLVGSSPIVEANPALLPQTRMAYWNNMVFLSYVGMDGSRHRLILHTVYKRYRNDDLDAQSLLLEADTNQLLFGDSNGLVHIDRQIQAYDEGNDAGALVQLPIVMNLQTPYSDQGMPAVQKNYNDFVIDCNTNGATLTVTLLFNDGAESLVLGTVSNTERGKINLVLNDGDGYQAYKVSVLITGNVSSPVYIYQLGLAALALPRTRKSFDSYDLTLGMQDSKYAKNVWFQYSATAPINFEVYYDGATTPGFSFTLPTNTGIRNALRQRLPAISFRYIRLVAVSTGDFMLWQDCKIEFKPQASGKGYQVIEFVPD